MKKTQKRKKISIKKIIVFSIIIVILYFIVSILLNTKTKNIIILNNNYYNDEDIMTSANIENYPKFLLLNTKKIENKIKKLDLIEDVKVYKKMGFILRIEIKEKKILYFVRSENKYMLSDNKTYEINDVLAYPTLINYVPENIQKSFNKELYKIDDNIIRMISEIEYSKTEFDDKRFKLLMNDGNQVYITISRTNLLNKYIDIIKKIDNKSGILYLDSGNYFEIKN